MLKCFKLFSTYWKKFIMWNYKVYTPPKSETSVNKNWPDYLQFSAIIQGYEFPASNSRVLLP